MDTYKKVMIETAIELTKSQMSDVVKAQIRDNPNDFIGAIRILFFSSEVYRERLLKDTQTTLLTDADADSIIKESYNYVYEKFVK